MSEFRERVGNGIITPYGQSVLIESVTYIPEVGLTMSNKADYKAFSIHKIVGYGGLTFECQIGDYPQLINIGDARPIILDTPLEVTAIKATLDDFKKGNQLKGSIKDLIKNAETSDNITTWQEIVNAKRYVRTVNYAMTQEANLEHGLSFEVLKKRLIKYFITEKVEPIKLDILKDDYITDEFIAEYKVEYEKNLKLTEVKPTIIL